MARLSLPSALSRAIGVFAPVFSRPVWQPVKGLMTGAVLAPGQRTVTAILPVRGRSTAPDFQTSHRGLQRAVWSPLTARRLLLRLRVAVCSRRSTAWYRKTRPTFSDAMALVRQQLKCSAMPHHWIKSS